MSEYVVAPLPPVVLPIAGIGAFPVRRVFCVGRNYAEHAREMGHDPDREPPFFFSKPADALVAGDADVPYPPRTQDLHFEVELVAAIWKEGSDIDPETALTHVWGYGVGIDLTRRDLQAEAKKAGRPWDMAKGFDASAPIGKLMPVDQIGHRKTGAITLKVNGEIRQSADISDMIWSPAETIAHLSGLVRLMPGDLVFTGTPAGVGACRRGDLLEGEVEGIGTVTARIV
ncbi:FAA hydrolase family protein [Arsenicitalea aurantiaca]|uniref:FAA hydrolase family protein n=1 Tax=Arsenicitalea aurantiaca TaxID=1783274 RepID=A0A433X404_9HYPH|nr:fumarylacetoacetate hydrolase family protein [Arsenicitalea aurantiaca]RUT28794.1 FAA hydrolase family protein [Arsenicitalea aurantiaca]